MIFNPDQAPYSKHGTTYENINFFVEIISVLGSKMPKIGKLAEILLNMGQHIPEKSFQLVRYYGWYSNRTREVDPLTCPHCQGEMRIVSFINDYPVIRKILKHLDQSDRSPPVPKHPEPEELVYEPFDDG